MPSPPIDIRRVPVGAESALDASYVLTTPGTRSVLNTQTNVEAAIDGADAGLAARPTAVALAATTGAAGVGVDSAAWAVIAPATPDTQAALDAVDAALAAPSGVTVYQGPLTLADLAAGLGASVEIEVRDSDGNAIAEAVAFKLEFWLVDGVTPTKLTANGSCDLGATVIVPACSVDYYEDDGAGSKTGTFYVTSNTDGLFQGTFGISGSTGTYLVTAIPLNKPAMPTTATVTTT